jgi:hypothetical protein
MQDLVVTSDQAHLQEDCVSLIRDGQIPRLAAEAHERYRETMPMTELLKELL